MEKTLIMHDMFPCANIGMKLGQGMDLEKKPKQQSNAVGNFCLIVLCY